MKPYSENWNTIVDNLFEITPTPLQFEIEDWWKNTDSRVMLVVGGERSGKSVTASRMAAPCMRLPEDDFGEELYWIVGPDYYQCRPEFSYLRGMFERGEFIKELSVPASHSSPWTMTTKLGHRIETRTSADIQKLASFSVSGAIMAEAAQQNYEVYLKLLGRVSETRGFLILVGTLEEGLPWYEDLYRRWQGPNILGARSFSMPTWSNTFVYPLGREDPAIVELAAETPEDLFMERYGAEPRRAHGVVIPEFAFDKHVRALELDEEVPVELWIDPGKNVYAVLFVQCIGLYTHVLDRVYAKGRIAQDVIPEVMGNKLFKHVDKENAGVMDIAGKQQHANISQMQLWKEMAGCSFRSQYLHEDITIEAIRYRLRSTNVHHEPLVYFNSHFTNAKDHSGHAMDVLAEFELWRWPDRSWRQNEARRPTDRDNHALKALGYGLVDRYGILQEKKKPRKAQRRPYWVAEPGNIYYGNRT